MDFGTYLRKHGLKDSHIYLLELIPIIEMIWADGRNQEHELNILYRATVNHLCHISDNDNAVEVISENDVNSFLHHFSDQKPDPDMLAELRALCIEKLKNKPSDSAKQTANSILDYCMDVAAACVQDYPYSFDERIVRREKDLLLELTDALRI